jgi:small-conductance mechanosensitive channel
MKLARQHEVTYSAYTEHVRALQTEYSLLYRVALVVVSIITIACMLMVFETVRKVGTSLLASAGLIGIVAGIAAQRSLANLFAGVQLALTQPILLGDVIEVEGDHGVVEQITISYVVIRQGDLRRLVLPISYFLEKPFRNWTKLSSEVVGSIKLFLDFRTPLQPLRDRLDSVPLRGEPLWNGKLKSVEITDLRESHMVVEVSVSANTPDELRSLCVKLREDLIQYLAASKSFGLPDIPR